MPGKDSHRKLLKSALRNTEVKKEYDALEEEFQLLEEMVKARKKAGLTQEAVAKIMKKPTSVIGRLETGGGSKKHSPTLSTLRLYAAAIGCKLQITFKPKKLSKSEQ